MKKVPKIEVADSSTIDAYAVIAEEFFKEILGLDPREVLATDESLLSDFGSCLPETAQAQLENCRSLAELYSTWDPLVLDLIEVRYGFRPTSTRVLLIDIFRDIELCRRTALTH